ncbi:MAG: alpha/beta hydrolase [Burkholderiales bacterium]|nr:alpha/beta hydrolase [Burkholderiales bacterium]
MSTSQSGSGFSAAPWDEADQVLQLTEAAKEPIALPITTRRRRGYTPDMQDPRASVSLHDDDGVLRWVYEPPPSQALRGRARRASFFGFGLGDALKTFKYQDIGPNQVTQGLAALDGLLTPDRDLRQWRRSATPAASGPLQAAGLPPLVPVQAPQLAGRTLLLVHGTFSKSEMWFEQLADPDNPAGQALLAQWRKTYGDNILVFDHPTLSVTPWINALDLHRQLRGVTGPIDIVCHSRGGLVVSWLLRLAPVRVRQVVFVGSPLDGTSLASPYRLRAALDLLANVANALSRAGAAASTVFPLAAGAAGLAKVLGKTLRLGATLPIADAAVALVPGLASQQRTDNNAETQRLFAEAWLVKPALAAVTADFEPNVGQPAWKFWTRFRNPGLQALNLGADLVFPGPNDLVVDTDSMTFFGAAPRGVVQGAPEVLALGKSATTYHTNYFRNPEVVGFIAQRTA